MKMMYRLLCFLFLLPVFMSADVHTDSLEIQLRSAEKSEKVSILNELAEYCISEFPEMSLEYSKQALLLLDKSDKGFAEIYNSIGAAYENLQDIDITIYYYNLALEFAIEEENIEEEASALYSLGLVYDGLDKYRKSLEYFLNASNIYYELGKEDTYANLLNNIGIIYESLNIYETEKKEKEIELLLLEQKHNKSIKTFFVIASIFLLTIAALLLYLYYVKNKEIKRRMKIEESLKDSEEMFRKLTEYLKTAVYTFDLKGKFIYVNPATQEITGYSEDELLSMKFFELVHPDFKEIVEARGQVSAIKEDVMDHYEYKIIRKDGSERWIDISNSVINLQEKTIILGTALDITERKQTEGKIIASLEEKEVMLKEIHHRVKNNMQVISSLLKLQSSHITDEKSLSLFKNSQNRVKSMALVHEKLYKSKDLAKVDFYDYVKKLTTHLMISYGVNPDLIKIIIDVKNVYFNINTAIPCGLIINEIISNSLKYAFPDGRKGKISLLLKKNETENYIVIISDDGIGFPKDIDFKNTDSLGLQLVNSLTDQLHGTIEMENNKGTTYKIKFKGINKGNL